MKAIFVTLTSALTVSVSAPTTYAVVDQKIEVQGTNLVLSWPSSGYEHYLIQYRPTLSAGSSWQELTNNYPANSTNRTTYTIYGAVPPPPSGGVGGGSSEPPPAPEGAVDWGVEAGGPMVVSKDGSTAPAPLELYPPGFDLSGRLIVWPDGSMDEWSAELAALYLLTQEIGSGGPQTEDSNESTLQTGFFRIFHVPDFPESITNYVFDGPTFIPVDFKDYLNRVEDLEVLLDGLITDLADFTSVVYGNQTNWGVGLYCDRIPNGFHQIQLRSTLRTSDDAAGDVPLLVLSNLTRSIVVDNQVTFTNWDDMIWNNVDYTFRAQTKNPDTDWWIDIYDVYGFWVNGASGHTTNGEIEWTWDLTDYNGYTRDSLEVDPFFDPWIIFDTTSAPAGNGPSPAAQQTSRPMPITTLPYPNVGRWIIAYLDTFYVPGTSEGEIYTGGIAGIAGGPGYRDIPVNILPLKFGTNNYTQAERNDSWVDLKASMFSRDVRNFYYYGHGWATGIGGDKHVYDTNGNVTGGTTLPESKAFLTSKTVHDQITFNKHGGARPYRFVWLDGCKTALGNWPDAFGVNKGTNNLAFYTNHVSNPTHRRPSAFVGWTVVVGGPGWGSLQDFWNCRTSWMFDWQYNWGVRSLADALENGRSSSDWVSSSQFWDNIRVFGYRDLRMNEYNQKGDWPP